MTNLELAPKETEIGQDSPCREKLEVVSAREVPLGGVRAMTVRRTIPHRARSMVGAWCFADHYGPDDVTIGSGMQVAPHPHTALQTVTWLFAGEIEHRDSLGTVQRVRPGELNLMTAGHGISHSEGSPADRPPRCTACNYGRRFPPPLQVSPRISSIWGTAIYRASRSR